MMLSGDSGAGKSVSTPSSVSKRLFGASGSSSKRSLFGDSRRTTQDTDMSDEESDLGPMSPLALTDQCESSCDSSSPGRQFVSPFQTPEKSPRNPDYQTWDRLRPSSAKSKSSISVSPFSALRMSTRAARSSPKRRIHENSPTSLPLTPRRKYITSIGTPEREIALLFNDDIIPETPQKETDDYDDVDRVEETPCKDEQSQRTLITPLGSAVKQIVVPRIHRRKSSCPFDNEETSSPELKENNLKRHANDNLVGTIAKLAKIDDNTCVPKARASLFRDEQQNPTKTSPEVTVSTKSFYKTSGKRGRSMGPDLFDLEIVKKRHSLPTTLSNHTYHRRPAKRPRHGEMNAGVRHGIKRPKPKKHVSRVEAFKKLNQTTSPKCENPSQKTIDDETPKESQNSLEKSSPIIPLNKKMVKPSSPIADPNKRFFKTNRTMQSHHLATVTVSNKIKLNVLDGKIALKQKNVNATKNLRKKNRLADISFDTTDLTVDEPNFDTSLVRTNVDGILKVLEDDWADDDYDTMETLTVSSPKRRQACNNNNNNNVTMSPGSVLIDMTSSMNIEDLGNGRTNGKNVMDVQAFDETTESSEDTVACDQKLFPLFAKGFSSSFAEETLGKKSPRGTKRSWQTSMKGGCGGAEDQYQIDAGQKRFGATVCNECGIVYQLGDPEDENAHLNYHNSYRTLRFNGWKKERVIMTDPFTNSRIIAIEPGDSKICWKKVEDVLAVVDRDLGLADMQISNYLDKKIYFYVRGKTILAVMIAESVKIAHRMIPELLDLDCCSDEETPIKCGVNVIWTAMSHRRQHIATKLLDTVRATYYFGYIMSIDDIGFSMPTPSGKIFAEKYTKTRNFKVYT